ncbi:thyroid transcription factor 1-associated protein 26 homolog [Pogonomyrmex barbatus]|uniref:Thyroid transcription factor 1-associated protein 26 homolog n=1 Tax=Pogonomyrmex barbatus TaxID=144034 RepID=A0A6I9VT73_9HYME|nr:thyroid transcription factor 1-associated protein 26 homolog [Pogonomyrmex barbatus]
MVTYATLTMKNNMKNNNVKGKNRAVKKDEENKHHEKKFDKKKYRLQKYSNKYKIKQWEERRKKAVLRGFYKELEKDQQNSTQTLLNSSSTSKNVNETTDKFKKKGYAFFKAKQEYRRKQEEKKKRIEDAARMKAEREEAMKNYREKKMRNFKILSKRTKKGQPVMKGRIEMLLEKIQQSVT